MWRLLLFFIVFHTVTCSCPQSFELVSNGECRGKYNQNGPEQVSWDSWSSLLISDCNQIRGQPVIIRDDEQQSYWTGVAALGTTMNHYVALGVICNSSTKKWEWTDGSAVNYRPSTFPTMLDMNCLNGYTFIVKGNGDWAAGRGTDLFTGDIFCSVPLSNPEPSDEDCVEFDADNCYQISPASENWQEAQKQCRNFGADVASVHSSPIHSYDGELNGVFLGATMKNSNYFHWIDGSPWDYANFYSGFPAYDLGDCLLMDTESASGNWANVDCSSNLAVACERQQNYATTCPSGPWQEEQIISTPGYPFDAFAPCDFILSVDTGKRVEVEIFVLEANSCCDQLVLFENYFGSTVVANLTGEISNKKYTTSSSNYMRVSWRPNGGVNVRGAMMTFRGVP